MKRYAISAIFLFALNIQAQSTVTGISPKVFDANVGECHFRLTDPFNGRLRVDLDEKLKSANYHGPLHQKGPEKNDLWIQVWCVQESKVNKKNCGLELENGKLDTDGLEALSQDERRSLNQTLITLIGKGWTGSGVQEDQISGDEELRSRSFNFCIPIPHRDYVVEGRVESAAQLNNLKESAMPNIIKLLESIEFIDDTKLLLQK